MIIKNTKELIWKEALNLFSEHGYEGVSVKEIAKAVGIKDSSLYNHYQSKQEIFDTILVQVTDRLKNANNTYVFPITTETIKEYENTDVQELAQRYIDLFEFYLQDDIASKFRKMLVIEQYSSPRAAELFNEIFIDMPLNYITILFTVLIQKGKFIHTDAYIMALNFYSPLFLLLFKSDSATTEFEQLKSMLTNHIEVFIQNHGNIEK
ncbi:TetR/AcrR family transcriptional regulator [Enterococcus sp. BWR-S5]|nr:TetR/AcrR family transcriptional regulator [Enterococcus sp. BWR-S5]